MNSFRRLLSVILITLSCLFAIQPAGALNSHSTGSVDGGCTNVGPTVFSLGLGTASASTVVASIPACLSSDAGSTGDQAAAKAVRVPIEGSLMVSDEPPAFVIAAEYRSAAGSSDPVQRQSRPDQIGPTI